MSIAVVKQEPVQLLHLTSLRFFAALAVLFFHQGYLKSLDNPLKDFAVIFFNEGYSGVSFFFVLSGFILGYSYQKNIKSKTISVKKYLLLRLSRIFPLHLFTAFIFIFSKQTKYWFFKIYPFKPSIASKLGFFAKLLFFIECCFLEPFCWIVFLFQFYIISRTFY